MNKTLALSKTIDILAGADQVWDTLTNPTKNKDFFRGTEVFTDWKVGSPIIFQGEFLGRQYKDKGNVLEIQRGNMIQYDYWTAFSGLEDQPGHYSLVT